ncbi:N-acetyltransferase GCN5 [Zopfochytrium polystomum]|nr:N-acetyltransferase GCN5 [Zopfochytrium polystomum]
MASDASNVPSVREEPTERAPTPPHEQPPPPPVPVPDPIQVPVPAPFRLARDSDAAAVVELVNSAYRGDSGRAGWTTESDYLDGQRMDEDIFHQDVMDSPDTKCLLVLPESAWVAPSGESASTSSGTNSTSSGDGERLVGCILVERVSPSSAYIGMVTVRPTAQGGGLGSKLLAAAEAYAVARFGAEKAVMTVLHMRHELLAFYARRGFLQTGERVPFMYGEPRFGIPKRDDLEFVKVEKSLVAPVL